MLKCRQLKEVFCKYLFSCLHYDNMNNDFDKLTQLNQLGKFK
jgi:hypothetical protein